MDEAHIDEASGADKWGKHIADAMRQAELAGRRGRPNPNAATPEIDGFDIEGVVGVGGMGLVYRAKQQRLHREVALKFLPAFYESVNPDAVARFRREATAAARLHHTNIIPIYDFGRCPQGYYYVMELIEGRPLSEVIRSLASINIQHTPTSEIAKAIDGRRLARMSPTTTNGASPGQSSNASKYDPPTGTDFGYDSSTGITKAGKIYFHQVAGWIASVAEALDYAHGQGIVHRDIKPSNLILAQDGRLMVGDFGIARSADDASVTLSGALVGTPKYMSPEQAAGKTRLIDHHTDIYSLGATLYELLTFQPAIAGTEQSEILRKIVQDEPSSPRKINAQVPRDLATICLKMMEKAPSMRYRRARHIAEDLRRYVDNLPIRAKPPNVLQRAIKFVRRHRAGCIAGLLIAMLLVVGTLGIRESSRHRHEAQERLIETAIAHIEDNEWADAETAFQAAYELNPRNDWLLFSHAWAKMNQFNREFAHAIDRTGAERTESAVTTATKSAAGMTLLEDADKLCRQGLVIAPDNVSGTNIHGIILKKLGHTTEAIEAFARVVELEPKFFAAWANLAMMHALAGELDQAEQLLREATIKTGSDEPYGVEPWRNLASLQLFRGKPETHGSLQRAIDHNHTDPTVWLIRARMLLQLPAYQDAATALDDVKHAVKLLPNLDVDDPINAVIGPRYRRIFALAHLRNGQFEQAGRQAGIVVERGDDFPFCDLVAALSYAGLGKMEEAISLESRILSHWPVDLAEPGEYRVSADQGVLWFDSARELIELRDELASKLRP